MFMSDLRGDKARIIYDKMRRSDAQVKAVYFGDDIYIVMDESVKKKLPPGAIIYTLKEAQMLAGQSESVKKTAHEIKKMGGIVTKSIKYQKDGKKYP